MKAINWFVALICFLLLIRCAPLGIIPTGSEEHKATIVYFNGGDGYIRKDTKTGLYGRSKHFFLSKGIKMDVLSFTDLTQFSLGQSARTTDKHFHVIQEKVNNLWKLGHENIWLMGLSNGVISVRNAGAKNIQGVNGLIVINPPPESFSEVTTSGVFVDLDKITLPILMVTHEKDACGLKYWSKQFSEYVYRSSSNPEMVTLSGGRIGTSIEALHHSQEYQHGLCGLEKEFSQAVIKFIYSNSGITEARK